MVPPRSKCHLFVFLKSHHKVSRTCALLIPKRVRKENDQRSSDPPRVRNHRHFRPKLPESRPDMLPFLHQGKEAATTLPADQKSTIRVSQEQKGEEAELGVRSVTPPSPNSSPLFPLLPLESSKRVQHRPLSSHPYSLSGKSL